MPLEDAARARLAGRERPGAGASPRAGRFDRSLLPDSATYFARIGAELLGRERAAVGKAPVSPRRAAATGLRVSARCRSRQAEDWTQ